MAVHNDNRQMSLIPLEGQGSTEEQNTSSFEHFPEELILEILSYLPPEGLGTCSQVSRTWQRIASDNYLWRKHCQQAFPGVEISQDMSFKAFFRSHSIGSVDQLYEQVEFFYREAIEGGSRNFRCSFAQHPEYSIDLKLLTEETTPENFEFVVEEPYVMLGKLEHMGETTDISSKTSCQFNTQVQGQIEKRHYFGRHRSGHVPGELADRIYSYSGRIKEAPEAGLNGVDAFDFEDDEVNEMQNAPAGGCSLYLECGILATILFTSALALYFKYFKPESP